MIHRVNRIDINVCDGEVFVVNLSAVCIYSGYECVIVNIVA